MSTDSIPVQVRNLSMTFRQGANEIQALRKVSLEIGRAHV